MRLTIEENREAIKRYRHVKPAPRGSVPCSVQCPGTIRTCTLKRGHPGPHVSHAGFRKVVAVWEKRIKTFKAPEKPKRVIRAPKRKSPQKGKLLTALALLRKHGVPKPYSIEAAIFLIFALFFVGYFLAALVGLVPWDG